MWQKTFPSRWFRFSDSLAKKKGTEGSNKNQQFSIAVFPIAKRQLSKTFKFAQGSFLWHAYTFESNAAGNSGKELKFLEVKGENISPAAGNLNLVAANYMNDYFILAVANKSHSGLVNDIVENLSLYHSDFIKTL